MLIEKPRSPATDGERRFYAAVIEGVKQAYRLHGRPVTTAEVIVLVPYAEGGEPNPRTHTGRQRQARFVRKLKNAAVLDLIQGRREGVGFIWWPSF